MTEPIKEFEEMYLKTLYEFYIEEPQKPIRNGRIAEALGVSQAASSEMIHRLAEKGILYHIPYRGSTLTEEGVAAAARIKRRECLMEIFLIRMIDYQGDVKAAACRLEHALTDDLESAFDRLLGYPESTPSGDMIPTASRQIEPVANSMLIPLHALPSGMSGKVELLVIEGADSRTLADLGIEVGSTLQSTDDGVTVNGNEIRITPALSSRILIRTD